MDFGKLILIITISIFVNQMIMHLQTMVFSKSIIQIMNLKKQQILCLIWQMQFAPALKQAMLN